nr:S41 family peptidase [Candidatus Electrothrix aestuarii]
MEEFYVHLPLKRSMYAVEPVQRLKLLDHRLPPDDRRFHEEMISIFMGVRDLHTNYILPAPYSQFTAMLPFRIGEYFDDGERKYIVFATVGEDPSFRPGMPITHWNGIPIGRAVEINARLHAGGNEAASHSRGLQRMTVRPLIMSLPPDEEWIDIRYLDEDGKAQERRFEWTVVSSSDVRLSETSMRDLDDATLGHLATIGLDAENEVANHAIESVFEQKRLQLDTAILRFLETGAVSESLTGGAGPDFSTLSKIPRIFQFNRVNTPKGEIGRIQILTFNLENPDGSFIEVDDFLAEFVRITSLLPQDRLIIDVRNNGGGHVPAGEKLLQTITDSTIEPERLHFITSRLVLNMVKRHPYFSKWLRSLERAIKTSAQYSQGFPFEEQENYNQIGRKYPGKVLLITNAFCYSTTDIFAAGFRDHNIGPILGTDSNTGAGGANVFPWWLVNSLCEDLDNSPVQLPSSGASFRVAIRRTTRVGANAGEPLEDFGVEPDEVHQTTLTDLTEGDIDLYAHAADLLDKWQ